MHFLSREKKIVEEEEEEETLVGFTIVGSINEALDTSLEAFDESFIMIYRKFKLVVCTSSNNRNKEQHVSAYTYSTRVTGFLLSFSPSFASIG